MTPQLLNTFTNMGGTWPKWFVLKGAFEFPFLSTPLTYCYIGVDFFSIAACQVGDASTVLTVKGWLIPLWILGSL